MNAPPSELLALRCDGCKAHVTLGSFTSARVTSSHVGQPHRGCTAKGTWRGEYQLTLLEVPGSVSHG